MRRWEKPLKFSLAMLPFAIIGGWLICVYQFDLYDEQVVNQMIAQLGSYELAVAIGVIQSAVYAIVCSFFGYILAEKLGLLRSFGFEKKVLVVVLPRVLILGIIFSLDYWIFGRLIPEIADSYQAGITVAGFAGSILYGGIVEELLLRFFFMSLVAFVIWKLFFKKYEKEHIPVMVFVFANVISALLFAAGHLPATITAFGTLTPLLLFRCFLLNGGFGLYFGYVYRKYGIQYAMLAHAGLHIVSKVIWLVFIR
ncbi:MAG: CPBP family intramembrane metalloprotease [Hespellia sp.]|nr:CPBP family intramembrane metalloprotease [Hespellia sp.]